MAKNSRKPATRRPSPPPGSAREWFHGSQWAGAGKDAGELAAAAWQAAIKHAIQVCEDCCGLAIQAAWKLQAETPKDFAGVQPEQEGARDPKGTPGPGGAVGLQADCLAGVSPNDKLTGREQPPVTHPLKPN